MKATKKKAPPVEYSVSPPGQPAVLFTDARAAWAFSRLSGAWPEYRTTADPRWRDLPDPDAGRDPDDPDDPVMDPCCATYPICETCMCNGWMAHYWPFWPYDILRRRHLRKLFAE